MKLIEPRPRVIKKKIFCILLLAISLCLCYCNKSQPLADVMPYEATWMRLTEDGDSYIVHNFPSLWNDGETKNPEMIKIRGNELTWITYSDDIATYSFDKAEKRDNNTYFFLAYFLGVGNKFSFQWFDQDKHIARWTVYYQDGERFSSDYLYIDSLYNTFPIVNFEWPDDEPADE